LAEKGRAGRMRGGGGGGGGVPVSYPSPAADLRERHVLLT
jgi:hypothetical protein